MPDMSIPTLAPLPNLARATQPLKAPETMPGAAHDRALMNAARELESSFLAEMLKAAGLGEQPDGFGGGPGEEQFSSFLRLEQAREMVAGGGIGLAQVLFEAMKERENGAV